MTTPIKKRKGARSLAEIPPEILEQLSTGKIESANLMEWLAVDQNKLLESFLKQTKREHYIKPILHKLKGLDKPTAGKKSQLISIEFLILSQSKKDHELFKLVSSHKSDSIRCWGAFMLGNDEELSLEKTLKEIKVFANDNHFGVREIAWLAVRPKIAKNLKESIQILSQWTKDKAEGSRRFASEVSRPRGVWCKHINELKEKPWLGLPILESLKADSSKYVCDSVGNWLNDAGKNNPEWVLALCEKWAKESQTEETAYVIKKAKRNL